VTSPKEAPNFFILSSFCHVMLFVWSEVTCLSITLLGHLLLGEQKMSGTILDLCGSVLMVVADEKG
jgi:threonine/homoserine/homoserine lactone efflux protein